MNFDNAVSNRPGVWQMGGKMLIKVLLALLCCDVLLISVIMMFQYTWLLWIMELIVLAILIAFIYSPMFLRGSKDRGYFERNSSLRPEKFYGLKVGLIAGAPFFLMTVWLVLMSQGMMGDNFFLYRVLNPFFWPLISIFAPSSYAIDLSWVHLLTLFLLDCIIPLVCHIAYTLGFKGVFVSDKILYKNGGRNAKK